MRGRCLDGPRLPATIWHIVGGGGFQESSVTPSSGCIFSLHAPHKDLVLFQDPELPTQELHAAYSWLVAFALPSAELPLSPLKMTSAGDATSGLTPSLLCQQWRSHYVSPISHRVRHRGQLRWALLAEQTRISPKHTRWKVWLHRGKVASASLRNLGDCQYAIRSVGSDRREGRQRPCASTCGDAGGVPGRSNGGSAASRCPQ